MTTFTHLFSDVSSIQGMIEFSKASSATLFAQVSQMIDTLQARGVAPQHVSTLRDNLQFALAMRDGKAF